MPKRLAWAAMAALLVSACGGGSEPAQPRSPARTAEDPAGLEAAGSGPDSAQARERLLANANLAVPDAVRLVSYAETGVHYEGPPEMRSAIVNYEAELEFVADTYFHKDHKAGERARVYGEIEYLHEGGTWRLIAMGIHPR